MPVLKCSNGKYRIGGGSCIYETEEAAYRAWAAIRVAMADSYNDYPQAAVNAAKRAIAWAEKNGWGSCLTQTGKSRAHQIANKENITRETISRMASFARHLQYKDVPYSEGCGGLAVDAWGGQAGIEWAQRKLKELKGE